MGWDIRDGGKCQGREMARLYVAAERFRGISKDIRSRIFHLNCARPGELLRAFRHGERRLMSVVLKLSLGEAREERENNLLNVSVLGWG